MNQNVIMKLSEQLLLITTIIFIFFAPGCVQSLPQHEDVEPHSGFFREENVGEVENSSDAYQKHGASRGFTPTVQGMPGHNSMVSFNDDPITDEPFLPEEGGNEVASILQGEEVRRESLYHSSDRLKDIHFAVDRYRLDEGLRATLEEYAMYLKSHPFSKIEIQGYCDERGSNNYNMALGERRAQAIKSYLVLLGVDRSLIHTVSFGEEKPFCSENNEKCWYQNRKVRFLVSE